MVAETKSLFQLAFPILLTRSVPNAHMRLYDDLLANGYYTTRLWIGTPPQQFALIVDTGSTEKVPESEKTDQLLALLVAEASRVEGTGHPFPLTIVFVERKTRCDEVAEALVAQGLHAVALHGGRTQTEREAALRDFRKGTTSILVATDVASRGLDVSGVAHVINLDLPKSMEDYVHRIGRTGRAGLFGTISASFSCLLSSSTATQLRHSPPRPAHP
ncbi:hypothetical protein COP2_034776 [Malus domestica]